MIAGQATDPNADRLFRQTTQTLRLVRQGTGTFSAGADGFHHHNQSRNNVVGAADQSLEDVDSLEEGNGALLQRQASQPSVHRQQSQQQMQQGGADRVQEQVFEEIGQMVRPYIGWICLSILMFVLFSLFLLVLWFRAAWAALRDFDKPCDQPLQYYVLTAIINGTIARQVQAQAQDWTMTRRIALTVCFTVLGWCIIGWGFYMVHESRKCEPSLFVPTQQYIYAQAVFTPFFLGVAVFTAISLRPAMMRLARLAKRPGCKGAIHKLPKVDVGSSELKAADGEVVACSICLMELSDPDDPPVRTPCQHYFHEECLAKLCDNHTTCPLCRQELGPPDSDDGSEGASESQEASGAP